MAELLIEILSEEIPARMQSRAAEDLKKIVVNSLHDIGLKIAPSWIMYKAAINEAKDPNTAIKKVIGDSLNMMSDVIIG